MTVLIVAGEASGDLHGSNLIKALKGIDPILEFYGVGGERMKGAGLHAIEDSKNLAVIGISEVFFKLGKLYSAFNKLKNALDKNRPDVVVLIDFPDFNLHLAQEAKKREIPVVYYIGPQVWAWRRGRAKKIARLVDRMLVVFPFEKDIYSNVGVDVVYVGHPLVRSASCQLSKTDASAQLGLEQQPTIALLPGSRRQEVERLLPVMLEAASLIAKEIKDVQFVLPLADTIAQDFVEGIIADFGFQFCAHCAGARHSAFRIVKGRLYEALRASDAAIVASGTATLETALIGTPMVIVYKVSLLTYLVGKLFVDVDFIGLPNIVAGKRVAPELIQGDATPSAIAENILRILKDKSEREKMISELKEVGKRLGTGNASQKAAEAIYKVITQSSKFKSQNLN